MLSPDSNQDNTEVQDELVSVVIVYADEWVVKCWVEGAVHINSVQSQPNKTMVHEGRSTASEGERHRLTASSETLGDWQRSPGFSN